MNSTATMHLPFPVLIVEDEAIIQERLKKILIELGYQGNKLLFAANVQQASTIIQQVDVAFALVDLGLPDGHGSSIIAELHQKLPEIAILVISAWSTQDAILRALQAGATGYLLKERDDLEVSLAIRSVLRGGAPIDPFIARQILNKIELQKKPQAEMILEENLSHREHEILELVAQGMSNREIAEHIHLSRYTVECHIKNIYRKLSVSTRTKAINTARSLGLLD